MSEKPGFQLRIISLDDRDEVTRLIFHSTNQYYLSIGREPIFKGDESAPSDIFDVYQRIDPDEGIVAVDDQSNQIIGSCFVHPRETHFSLGIMNAHPDHFGRGVARAILAEILDRARQVNKPIRLVSSWPWSLSGAVWPGRIARLRLDRLRKSSRTTPLLSPSRIRIIQ